MTAVVRDIYDQEQNLKLDKKVLSSILNFCFQATRSNPILNLIWNLLQMVN